MSSTWQLQHAKARFSALVDAAAHAPQIVTRRGRPEVVVLSHALFRRLIASVQKSVEKDGAERG